MNTINQSRIVVIGDKTAALKNIKMYLEDIYEVSLAKSGSEALEMCTEQIPDLILLDIEMPAMAGFEILSRIRGNVALSRIPVIFLTSNHNMASKVEALESGAVDFITKPFERNILHHRVGLHLKLAGYQHFLEETVKELENDILLSFAELMEGRDKNTGGHVQRTALYMDSLCRELMRQGYFLDELNDDVIPLLKRAALLHDIGKIGISDNILSKSGRFNNEEFAEMKTHTTIGSDILESMYNKTPTQYYLKYAKTIAEGHHEKYDGTGYPYGLSGDSIPLCSRIMAVADVYDALVANRGYRKAMSHDDACELILSGKGTQFDPRVVGAFEAVNEEMAKMKNSLFVETLNQNIKGRVLELYTEST